MNQSAAPLITDKQLREKAENMYGSLKSEGFGIHQFVKLTSMMIGLCTKDLEYKQKEPAEFSREEAKAQKEPDTTDVEGEEKLSRGQRSGKRHAVKDSVICRYHDKAMKIIDISRHGVCVNAGQNARLFQVTENYMCEIQVSEEQVIPINLEARWIHESFVGFQAPDGKSLLKTLNAAVGSAR